MENSLQEYLENIKKPWGVLFYKVVWHQLKDFSGRKILDYGSGFGLTANQMAKNNEVVAIDSNKEMVNMRIKENSYEQLVGGIELLKKIDDNSFDMIICHNVLEYVEDPREIIKEFSRLLKKNGHLSIVKHNREGRVMQKVIFENNLQEALLLLDGEDAVAQSFGKINYYEIDDLLKNATNLQVEKLLGIRTFWGLERNNEIKHAKDWQDKMLALEMKVCEKDPFINISFFNHILLQKV